MLADPLMLVIADNIRNLGSPKDNAPITDAELQGFHIVDIVPGRVIRKSGSMKLTISHSESKENVGQITDRIAIRLEDSKTNPETMSPVVAQVTVTASLPRSGDFTTDALVAMLQTIAGTVILRFEAGNTVANADLFTRVLTGEG